jgi:diguanylate cyclase
LLDSIHIVYEGQELKATLSLGVVCCPQHGTDAKELLEKADVALYAAKQAGRNRVVVWDETAVHAAR